MSELEKQIKSIEENIASISKSSLPNGTKNDILETLNKLQTEIKEIEPLYENIDSLKNLLIEPTNIKIAESYKHFDEGSKKSEKKNNIFFIISFIFGLLGIVLTVIPIIQTGLKTTITYSYNGLNQIFNDFDWIRSINYKYQKNILERCNGFTLSSESYNQLLKLHISITENTLLNNKDISTDNQLIIVTKIESILMAYFGEKISVTLIKYDKSYDGYEFSFSVQQKYLDVVNIIFKKNDICSIITKTNIESYHEYSYKTINFGNHKEEFISEVCDFISLLTGEKYMFNLEDTISQKYIYDTIYKSYNQAIILSKKL